MESPKFVAKSTQKHDGVIEFSPDDRFIASFLNIGAKLYDASNLSLIWEHPGEWYDVAFHPLGNRIIFYGGDSLLDVNIEDVGIITATKRESNLDLYSILLVLRTRNLYPIL